MAETLRAAAFLDKGGVGKTTATAHLGTALHNSGHDVLLVDLAGKQNDLAKHFGLLEEVEAASEDKQPNIAHVFGDSWEVIRESMDDAANQMTFETDSGPDLIPAHKGLDQVDDELASQNIEDRFTLFDEYLTTDIEPLGYDVILVDLPGLTNNITLNGLCATGNVVSPVELGTFEERQLEALLDDLDGLSEIDQDVSLEMVIPNRVNTQTRLGRELLEDLSDRYSGIIGPEHIPQCQDIRNAQSQGMTVFGLEEPSKTASRACEAYETNATELINRLEVTA